MQLLVVQNGKVLGELSLFDLPDVCYIGREWIVVEAISEVDALNQAEAYDNKRHPFQKEMAKVFSKLRNTGNQKDLKTAIIRELYPVIPINSITLKIEAIGHMGIRPPGYKPRTWVAEITDLDDNFQFKRLFLNPKIDFKNADRRAYRGVFYFYTLHPNKIYDVSEPITTSKTSRYFCRVENKKLVKMDCNEVTEWLKNH